MGRELKGRAACALLAAVTLLPAGCTHPHETRDERIQREAAESAREVRHDAQNAGVEAKKAARQAGREAKDIIVGVREGWQEGAPAKGAKAAGVVGADRIELNTAPVAQLETLPGVSRELARRMVSERPYKAPGDLLRRGIVTRPEYARMENKVTVRR